ncbi:hypothetical protein HUS70_09465 [Pandoraea nosoerga]|uniref:Uncharacterized protein n=1 Tax=Pandoraea nosoerga TaxID=2508296 RepID=A0A5E4X583_9BURK|nr:MULTISPECIES: hypothetical protein [Pandoraea]MBN4665126.1 hypothetical protein [Pandoraea nosoerga]MBN4675158.1 hypothetical protein [Pandoraea nosoerga]MBN4680869.1 hypothetical protein [Pandoraea nosoerga]MBN4744871.1 hypothetical protein [Pandoraea nosoerga]VVE31305.1 hypothetical protein PNO31109_03647 [Pandoraea nosoerga]
MSDAFSRAFAVVINQYRSPRQYTVSVERASEMIAKNIGLFSDGFAGEGHLVVGLFEREADAWALAHRLQRTRTTMQALLQVPARAAPISPPELDPSE